MTRSLRCCLLAAPLLLAACVSIPTGPSVASFPGSGKSFDQFRGDDSECRQYATDSVGGSNPTEVQADSAVKSAAVGTAIGALAGAALGGRGGAGAGAGAGLLFGALVGSESANTSGYVVQRRYDNAYLQCMYAKGHQVPASGPIRSAVPMYNAPGVSPTYYYPPPPPPPSPPAG